ADRRRGPGLVDGADAHLPRSVLGGMVRTWGPRPRLRGPGRCAFEGIPSRAADGAARPALYFCHGDAAVDGAGAARAAVAHRLGAGGRRPTAAGGAAAAQCTWQDAVDDPAGPPGAEGPRPAGGGTRGRALVRRLSRSPDALPARR